MKNKIKMKQTAVEWLEDYIQKEINKHSYAPMNIEAIHALNHIKDYACKQAKEMEEQRIKQELEKLKDFEVWKEWKNSNDL